MSSGLRPFKIERANSPNGFCSMPDRRSVHLAMRKSLEPLLLVLLVALCGFQSLQQLRCLPRETVRVRRGRSQEFLP